MSRQVRLPTLEMGDLQVFLIRTQNDGAWEDPWEALRGNPIGDLFSVVSQEAVDHAFHRYSKPLIRALGLPPEGALIKLPSVSKQCFRRGPCPLFDSKQCFPGAKRMPWCFEPEGIETEALRQLITQAIDLWRRGIYIVVVGV